MKYESYLTKQLSTKIPPHEIEILLTQVFEYMPDSFSLRGYNYQKNQIKILRTPPFEGCLILYGETKIIILLGQINNNENYDLTSWLTEVNCHLS
jgi:hypothetical protein